MNYELISNPAALVAFLQKLSSDDIIAIDTEFMREKTFFAELCLVQIGGKGGVAVIDTLAPGLIGAGKMDALWDFLNDPARVKVLHAGSQDIEIIYHLTKKIFPNIIDTQLASAVLGLGDNLGYQKLVEIFLKKNLDKTMQFINWYKRPLPARALDYAALDVIYLLEIYDEMKKMLVAQDRMVWLKEEMNKLLDVKSYALDPASAWKRLKRLPKGGKKMRAVQLLAAWRDEQAVKRNLPRGFVLRDELLLDICNHLPTRPEDLKNMRGAHGLMQHDRTMAAIFDIMKQAMKEGSEAAPSERKESVDVPENALEVLKLLLKIVARQQNVVARVIAREADLIDFLLKKPEARIMQDWRYEVFGKRAEKLLRGELSFTLKNNDIEFIESP
ncbi:MAG: ribonuclease D [Hydrotalea sp.]|nr:ribonuclease D [Hydrotalea sp.]